MNTKNCLLLEKFCPLFKHFAQWGVFWGGVGGVLCTYIFPKRTGVGGILGIWAKWDPSEQFIRKMGKSALELGKENSIMWGLAIDFEVQNLCLPVPSGTAFKKSNGTNSTLDSNLKSPAWPVSCKAYLLWNHVWSSSIWGQLSMPQLNTAKQLLFQGCPFQAFLHQDVQDSGTGRKKSILNQAIQGSLSRWGPEYYSSISTGA